MDKIKITPQTHVKANGIIVPVSEATRMLKDAVKNMRSYKEIYLSKEECDKINNNGQCKDS